MAYKRSSTADRHEGMRNPVEIPTAPDRPFQRLISPGGARSKSLGCPKTGHWFIGFRKLSLYSTESLPKAKRAGLSQGEIRLFGYSFSSKSNRTAVKPIPHKPRFHAGLRAVRQSNGFIVGTKADSLLQATDFNESLLYLAKIKIFNSRLQQVSALIRIEMCKI